jgi:hypothetical protein
MIRMPAITTPGILDEVAETITDSAEKVIPRSYLFI